MDYIEEKKPGEYQIKKITLGDGMELDIDKIIHITIIKDKADTQTYDFKISYCCKTKTDFRMLSNKCNMMAHVFKFMGNDPSMSFEKACRLYEIMLEKARNK